MALPETAEQVVIGRVIGLWGVQGWVRIYSDTQPPDAIFSYQPWLIGPGQSPYKVLDWRRQGPRLMARLEGIDDPDRASALIDSEILVPRACLPEPDPGRFYWSDLIGARVVNLQEHVFGAVHGLIETGANDVMDIRDETGRSVLIPFVRDQVVKQVDLQSERIVVDWPLEWTEE